MISEGEEVLAEKHFFVPRRSHRWEKEETVLTLHGQQTEMVSVEVGEEMDLLIRLVSANRPFYSCVLSDLAFE